MSQHCPELLAPAGTWDCAKAAVENGADAIYFGLDRFNARMRSQNFTESDLPELMAFLHRRGVKGYVTFNTLIFPGELAAAERYLRTMIAAGVDAAIVQDVGMCRLIRHLSPDFPIHGSTQMTVTSAAGVEFAHQLGAQLVVLARECSLKDIEKIQQQTQEIALPLEVFVHGALCVAYSGQCLTSESLGGRSANRGECAQACRMTYDMKADGEPIDLGDKHYLLSPQDLSGLPVLPDLIKSGVSCLKIEGRLKAPEYVANVTRVYRQALDRAWQDMPVATPSSIKLGNRPISYEPTAEEGYNLETAFSRGLYTGWFRGINNQELVHARFAKKRGVYLGNVVQVTKQQVQIQTQVPVKAGDGIVFDSGQPDTDQGGRIYGVEEKGHHVSLSFGKHDLDLRRIKPGYRVWKTSDPELEKTLRQSYGGNQPQIQQPIDIEVYGSEGETVVAIATDPQGHITKASSEKLLEIARNNPLTTERLKQQLGRLGNTPFKLGKLANHLDNGLIVPVSELNRLRRELVAQLLEQRERPQVWELAVERSYGDLLPQAGDNGLELGLATGKSTERSCFEGSTQPTPSSLCSPTPSLIPLVRNLPQLRAVLALDLTTVYCELENPVHYRDAMALKQELKPDVRLFVAPPRITKPREQYILKQVRQSNADGYLVRNYDHLQFFANQPCIGDFSLNVANPITANYFKQQFGLERLTASYDLNVTQLLDLLGVTRPHWFDITIHQHMPMFHMEHCVFCAFLSDGTDFTNCGRPCEKHQVVLCDRTGTEHVLQADAGCRNTLYNGVAQTGAEFIPRLIEY
ncbi:MAG: U32 family peptidase, partial [Cyanobacteria bacterium P01_C01_bin.118]